MKELKLNIITKIVIFIWLFIIAAVVTVAVSDNATELTRINEQLTQLEQEVSDIQNDTQELWKNIDAIEEDYTTIWEQLYGENSWR
jgi:septal ring factor EnvC (AmiA/AmiB activator)